MQNSEQHEYIPPVLGSAIRVIRQHRNMEQFEADDNSGYPHKSTGKFETLVSADATIERAERLSAGVGSRLSTVCALAEVPREDMGISEHYNLPASEGIVSAIECIRNRLGLSKTALCAQSGIGDRTLGRINNREASPMISVIDKIAQSAGLTLTQMIALAEIEGILANRESKNGDESE